MIRRLRDRARDWWQGLGSGRVRAILLVIIFVGGGLRVAWVAYAGEPPQFASDPAAYLFHGQTIARGDGYTNPLVDIENVTREQNGLPPRASEPSSFYPPGYPSFIAAVVFTAWHTPIPDGDLVRTIEYVQALLGALSILLVFVLARRVFDARVGLIAAAIVAVYPNLIATTGTLQFETFFITLVLVTLLVLLPSVTREDPGRVRLIVGGVLIGLGAFVHPTIGFLLFAFLAVRLTMHRPWRETVRDLLILTTMMLLVVVPWTIRNAVQFDAFVPLATGAGPALCQSRNPEAHGGIDLGILDRHCRPAEVAASYAKEEVAVNQYSTSQAIKWVLHHPVDELKMWWHRTELAYRDDTSGLYAPELSADRRADAKRVFDVASYLVLGLAVAGAVIVFAKRRTRAAIFLVAATIAFAAMPIVLFGDPRYRVPAEPLFAILAAATIGTVAARREGRFPMSDETPDPDSGEDELTGLLRRLQRLVDPRGAMRVAQGSAGAAWRGVTNEEPRIQVTVAIVVAIGLMLLLPDRVASHPKWVLPGLAVLLLIGVFVARTPRFRHHTRLIRIASLSLIAVISLSNAVSAGRLIVDLVRGEGITDPAELLLTGGAIWLTNVIVFAVWYWEFDRGGPIERAAATQPYPDFVFTQMTNPELAPPDWEPGFVDYLYLSFTNAMAFSPTDVMPMTRWAKLIMLTQSIISVVILVLVIARAVNVLR